METVKSIGDYEPDLLHELVKLLPENPKARSDITRQTYHLIKNLFPKPLNSNLTAQGSFSQIGSFHLWFALMGGSVYKLARCFTSRLEVSLNSF